MGGDFHGQVFTGPARLDKLDVPLPEKRIGKIYGHDCPAEITVPLTQPHSVRGHTSEGKRYAIASREESLDDFDIDALIIAFSPAPH